MSDTEPYEERDTDARHETNTDGIGNIVLETEQKRPKPSAKKNPTVLREEGRSLLPHTRVQKIIKADKVLLSVAHISPGLTFLAGSSYRCTRSCICYFDRHCAFRLPCSNLS